MLFFGSSPGLVADFVSLLTTGVLVRSPCRQGFRSLSGVRVRGGDRKTVGSGSRGVICFSEF